MGRPEARRAASWLGDGAEESFVELALASGKLVVHPIDSAAELAQLPEALAALIENSPAYSERFRLMMRPDEGGPGLRRALGNGAQPTRP